jgi:two-component system, NarL family, response regulator NreC
MITLLIADDHHIVRHGLRAVFDAEPDFSVVGEVEDGSMTLELVSHLKPHVLIVDLMMPGLGGLEVTRQVRQRYPATRVIVLSMHANEAYVLEALRNGAMGYVLKDTRASVLVQAIREVIAGHYYLSPPLSERAIIAYVQTSDASAADPYHALTAREREVLHLAAEGLSNTELAAKLTIGIRTVETHRANLMSKLGLQSQTDLIRYALRRGIISLDT